MREESCKRSMHKNTYESTIKCPRNIKETMKNEKTIPLKVFKNCIIRRLAERE
jgi:hypothetical protein